MIGLGLSDEKDISIKGKEAIERCKYIFLEDYTSQLDISKDILKKYYNKEIISADRNLVEKNSDNILNKAKENNVAFLVVGDVFSATTHTDLFLRAKEKNIEIKIIHNTSILTAVGQVGLELYKYGKTTSMPFFEKSFEPETPYKVIKSNLEHGLHTLILLDIKKKENRFMTINIALEQFKQIEKKRKERIITKDLRVVGCARIGNKNSVIKYGKVKDLINFNFGEPLHCLIIPGKLHFMEEEMLKLWS